MLSDGELLAQFVSQGSEAAFTEIVSRHVGLVHRAALRRVGGDDHAAKDVTQRVFTDLARKARSLAGRPNLAGWLHTGTRYAAAELVRAQTRRRAHEREATAMNELNADDHTAAEISLPWLDQALDTLGQVDREAVLLHVVEGLTFAEVGQALALSPDAARMRVSRALERTRDVLKRRGIASTAGALAAVLATPAGFASPVGEIARTAIRQAPLGGTSLWLGLKAGTWAVAVGGAAVLAGSVAAIHLTQASPAKPAIAPTALTTDADPAPASVKANPDPGVTNPFLAMPAAERNVLKRLWVATQSHPLIQGVARVSIRIGPEATGTDGINELIALQLISEGKSAFHYGLTRRGLTFCENNRAALDAYKLRIIRVGP